MTKTACRRDLENALKIRMYGPDWPRRVDRRAELGKYEPYDEPPFETSAVNLGEAISSYENQFSAKITLYDGSYPEIPFKPGEEPRYFFFTGSSGRTWLTDIHIFRGAEELCPKQDLQYPLQDGDLLEIGILVC
jgi:hypothetical protein